MEQKKEKTDLENKVKKFKLGKKIAFSLVIGAASAISLLQGCAYSRYYRGEYPYRNYHYYPYSHHNRYFHNWNDFGYCDDFGYYDGFGDCR